MDTEKVKGIIVLIVAPINQESQTETASLERIVEHVIQGGVSGILALGSSGEFFAIDREGQRKGLQTIVKSINEHVLVYMGTESVAAKEGVLMAKTAKESGADGLSILPPMLVSPTDDGLYQHMITIAKAASYLPALLYDGPGEAGYSLDVSLVVRPSQYLNTVGVKGGSGNVHLTVGHIRRIENREFKVVAGRNTLVLGSFVYGTVDAVASTVNVTPELIVSVYEHCYVGSLSPTRSTQFELIKFRNMFDRASFLIATKDACNSTGLDVGAGILPNTAFSDRLKEEMSEVLGKITDK